MALETTCCMYIFMSIFRYRLSDWNSARPRIVRCSNAAPHTQLESGRESRVELMQMKSKSAQWAPCVWTIKTSLLITSHPVEEKFSHLNLFHKKAKFCVELSAEKFCEALRYLRERNFTRRVKKCYWPINFSQWNCNVRDDRAARWWWEKLSKVQQKKERFENEWNWALDFLWQRIKYSKKKTLMVKMFASLALTLHSPPSVIRWNYQFFLLLLLLLLPFIPFHNTANGISNASE